MDEIKGYDSWKLANGQDSNKKTYGVCKHCEQPLRHDDEVKVTTKGTFHIYCFDDFIEEQFNPRTKYMGE